jgi:hypothetical protein
VADRMRRTLFGLLAAAMAGSLAIQVIAGPPRAQAASCAATAATLDAAARIANACHARVEDLSHRSERAQLFANPDGTATTEQSVVPARVHRRDGSWADVDSTLVTSGSRWVPAASTMDVALSNGGSGPFMTYATGNSTITLSWPLGALPAPIISGATAKYPNVLPGVSLWAIVTETGFRPVLEVADAASAANPRLAHVSMTVGGATPLAMPGGRVRFVDSHGYQIAASDSAMMWDSNMVAPPPPADVPGTVSPDPPTTLSALASTAQSAGDVARTAQVTLSVSGSALVLTPDVGLLTGAATVYPLFVDPAISPSQNKFAYADSANANNDLTYARVGIDPGDGRLYRSYFNFPTSQSGLSWAHTKILSAEFDAELWHSYSCDDTGAYAYSVAAISATPRMPWSGSGSRPLPGAGGDYSAGHANKGAGCSDSPQPDELMRFGADNSSFKAAVQTAANNGAGTYTIGLCACDTSGNGEATQGRWKKFYIDSRVKLIVNFDRYPTTPANLTTAAAACGSAIGTTSPTLKAQAVDPDGSDTMTASFKWQQLPSGAITTTAVSSVPANNYASLPLSLGSAADGHQYQWQVQTTDNNGLASPWTAWCTFTVDIVAPNMPTVTPTGTPLYSVCNPETIGTCTTAGGPGVPGTFTFSANGSGNVTSYKYGWTDPPTTTATVAAGASFTATLTPPRFGLNTLYVSSSNGVKTSPINAYIFLVGAPSTEAAMWPLDDFNGQNYKDKVSGTALTLAPNNPTWVSDARYVGAKAAHFQDWGYGTQAVPTFATDHSFSVTAWVRLGSILSGNMTAVGQDGVLSGSAGGFFLGLRYPSAGVTKWSFMLEAGKTDNSHGQAAYGSTNITSVDIGKWYHLTGVYDAGEKKIRLYVNGVLNQEITRTASPWKPDGPVVIGRGWWNGGNSDQWNGDIADVRLWNRAITADDLAGTDLDQAKGTPARAGILAATQVGDWDFSDVPDCGCGGPTMDLAYFSRGMYLGPGWDQVPPTAAFVSDDHNGNGAIQFNGAAYASTINPDDGLAQPVLRTDQSVTLSAWARADVMPATGTEQTVVQQGTSARSTVKVVLSGTTGKWGFGVTTPDGAGGWTWASSYANTAATTGVWTHLVAVFDKSTGQVRLYVNGDLQTQIATGAAGWYDPTASVHVGGLASTDFFVGTIDQVGLWQGVLSDREIANLYNEQSP